MAATLDRRLHAYRDDLADAALKGQVEATRFVEPQFRQVCADRAPLRRAPNPDSEQEAEAIFGERMRLFEEKDGWAWVQSERDGYVGYCEAKRLTGTSWTSSHVVAVPRTPLFSGPGLKYAVRQFLHMESTLEVLDAKDGYLQTPHGWVFAKHLCTKRQHQSDYVNSALLFIGVPYVWGGRSSLGLDCSGLVQVVLQRAGIEAPRDSDMQAKSGLLGEKLSADILPRRGDIIFWKGHVAIALDQNRVVHATGHHLAVVVEPLEDIDERARAESGEGVTVVRRPPVSLKP